MGRIEISLDEYNSMKAQIQAILDENVNIRKENELFKQRLEIADSLFDDVINTGFFQRLFSWQKNIITPIKKYLK